MMRTDIRFAVEADIPELARLESSCEHAAMWGESGIKSEIELANACVLKAETDGVAAGFIVGRFIAPEAQITNIAVSEKYRRAGVATALVKAFVDASKKHGCEFATLEVNETNVPALAFYSKLGFKIVGKRPKFYNGIHAAVLMDLGYGAL